jgi:polysaccharide deacetylase family protein (PEP-CTERM system associated)
MPAPVCNAFTVDLEDWYHGLTSTNRQPETWPKLESRVVQNTGRLLTLLAEYEIRATFFALGRVAERFPGLVRQIASDGHEIGVHGHTHRTIRDLTPAQFAAELDRSLEVLRPLASEPIIGHRAPYFSIERSTLWALEVLAERGFVYDSSVFPTRNMLYGYPDAPRQPYKVAARTRELLEFPLSTVRVAGVTLPVAGGFYGRAMPGVVTRWAVQRLNAQGMPAILYVHPWELDTGQRFDRVTARERVTHYSGRRTLETKLRRLFTDFEFGSLSDIIDVESTRVIAL